MAGQQRARLTRDARAPQPATQCLGALNAPEEQQVEVEVPLSVFWRPRVVGFSAPSGAGGRGPVSCGTDARGRQGQVRLGWAGAGAEPAAVEDHRESRLNATNPGVRFDGTPMGGGSGRCGKGFRARAWAGSGAAAHRLAGSAPRPAADPGSPSTSATAGHPAARLPLGARVWSRRASSRSIAPTGGGRAAAGGSRLESLLDSQLGLERAGRARKGPKGLVNKYITVHSRTHESLLSRVRRGDHGQGHGARDHMI